jgi:hypothetical protein
MRTFIPKPKNQDQRLEQRGIFKPGKTHMVMGTGMDKIHHYTAGQALGLVQN